MDILSYLSTLIKTHKEVGIPGLGTIFKIKSPGRYDINTHSFLPPSYTLNFTSDLKEQILLANLISEEKTISSDAATYYIEQFSENILNELSLHQKSEFGDLGTFSTISGSLTFIPKHNSNLGFDFYGLPTLKAESNTDKIEIFEEKPDPVQLELENNNADLSDGTEENSIPEVFNSPEEPVHFTLDYTDQEKTGMPAYLKAIIILAVVLILAGVAYLAKPEIFDGMLKKPANITIVTPDSTTKVKAIDQIQIDSIAQADSIRISNERAILAADSARDSIARKIAVPLSTPAPSTEITYEIIAASLLNKKEADNFLSDMKAKGIPAKVAAMPGRRIKISIGSFNDEESAKNQLEILKKTTKIPGIYIYKVRHTNNPK